MRPASSFGTLLRRYRQLAGLTQEALATVSGLSVRGIQDLERGVSRLPRPDTLALLGAALRLSPGEVEELAAAARQVSPTPRELRRAAHSKLAEEGLAPFVGRQRELAWLAQFLARADEVVRPTSALRVNIW